MRSYLDFEKPVGELEQKIEELRAMQASGDVSVADEIVRLEQKAAQTLAELYGSLTPWQKTQVARWPTRPHCLDYIAQLLTEFTPFSGDRWSAASGVSRARASASSGRRRATPRKAG
jgi:acetyl-CoA carboxylase carboxyl transferase subunit alpha